MISDATRGKILKSIKSFQEVYKIMGDKFYD